MKNIISFVILAVFSLAMATSCQNGSTTTTTVVKTTVKEMGTDGFLLKKVVKGDTVWGYSQETYGTGVEWRDIVAENPFLNEPGRIYYDQARQKWIVLIYPGETIRIKGQLVNPTFISEETTITTTPTKSGVPWWGWLCFIALGSTVIGGIIYLLTRNNMGRNCAATLHIGRGGTLHGAISERNAAGNRALSERFLQTADRLTDRGEFGNCRVIVSPDGGLDLSLRCHESKTSEQ